VTNKDDLIKEFFTLGNLLKISYESNANLKYINKDKVISRRQEIVAEFGKNKWSNEVLKDAC
jgi:hypothetical protein